MANQKLYLYVINAVLKAVNGTADARNAEHGTALRKQSRRFQ